MTSSHLRGGESRPAEPGSPRSPMSPPQTRGCRDSASSFFFFFFLAALCSTWDLSSLTRDRTRPPCSGSVEF